MSRYVLDAALPVLLRPDGAVQVGWDPRRAMLVHPPAGLTAPALAGLLRALQAGMTMTDLHAEAHEHGAADPADLTELANALADAGVLTADPPPRRRTPSVRIHGRGPLSDLLVAGLRCSGAQVGHTRSPKAATPPAATDLVVLADYLVAEPRVVRDLHTARLAHLAVRMRDGSGLIGPLVFPGRTSCLSCADLHRSDRDAAWPALAAQLRGTVGSADRATVLATAAVALDRIHGCCEPSATPAIPRRRPSRPRRTPPGNSTSAPAPRSCGGGPGIRAAPAEHRMWPVRCRPLQRRHG